MSISPTYKLNPDELAAAFQQLKEFVAIPSISNTSCPDYDPKQIQAAADYASQKLKDIHFQVRQVSIEGSAPYVLAEKIVDATKPTLLFYAHYDVQPVDAAQWKTPPFVIQERDGRLYGRGASDDKSGVIAIIAALGAYQKAYGALPVNVKILFEGEEEFGSGHMAALLKKESSRLQADGLVILDGGNAAVTAGTLTNSVRGLVNLHLEVRSMEKPVHSGVGCLVPDPSQTLVELLASIRNPRAIPGFMDDCEPMKPEERALLRKNSQTPESYASENGLLPGAKLRGDPKVSVYERITEEPSISFVNGAWGKPSGGNSIQEAAGCDIGIRLTPNQNPERIAKLLIDYLSKHPAGKGLQVTVKEFGSGCFAWKGDLSKPLTQKYLTSLSENFETTHVQPCGGSLPLLRDFQKAFPKMELIIPGVEDPKSSAHSHNESQDMGLFARAANSVISFIHRTGKV
jgi:cysteinylglycine-S-conjugate dipeptidase